jgi:hypothetical protein
MQQDRDMVRRDMGQTASVHLRAGALLAGALTARWGSRPSNSMSSRTESNIFLQFFFLCFHDLSKDEHISLLTRKQELFIIKAQKGWRKE